MVKWNISLSPQKQWESKSVEHLPVPFGFSLETTSPHVESPKKKEMVENKLFQMATSPKMQLFMTCILMFFLIGNTISIYSILAVGQSLINSISCIFKTNKVFEPFENLSKSLTKYKLIYGVINFAALGVTMYKLSKMGLLSFSSSAYIDMIPPYIGGQVSAALL